MASIQKKLNLLYDIAEDRIFLNSILDKLLSLVREQYKNRLKRYEADLKNFETRYGISSDVFYEKFETGKMGDATDFFEWSGIIDLQRDLLNKLKRLELSDETDE